MIKNTFELTLEETTKLDQYWDFIYLFSKPINLNDDDWFADKDGQIFGAFHYRKYIIKEMQDKYTPEEFYFFEKMLNKMLFNLLFGFNFKYVNYRTPFITEIDLDYNKSYSNKILLYDEDQNKLMSYNKNDHYTKLNVLQPKLRKLVSTLRDRETYEKIMKNKKYYKKIKFISHYYPDDYAFPNVNLMFYNENKKETWIENIKRLYYVDKCEENWYKNAYLEKIKKFF
jgi:hypothetical protein